MGNEGDIAAFSLVWRNLLVPSGDMDPCSGYSSSCRLLLCQIRSSRHGVSKSQGLIRRLRVWKEVEMRVGAEGERKGARAGSSGGEWRPSASCPLGRVSVYYPWECRQSLGEQSSVLAVTLIG